MGIGDDSPQKGYCMYVHQNPDNLKMYIGISNNVKRRWAHKEESYKHCPKIYAALKKYGWDHFTHLVLFDGMTKDEACAKETDWIKAAKLAGMSYNITDGGEGAFGTHRTEAEKQHLRECSTGRKHTQEAKEKMRKIQQELCGKNVYAFDAKTMEFIAKYASINDAARQLHTTYVTIARAVKGKRASAKGYIWSFSPYIEKNNPLYHTIKQRNNPVFCYDLSGQLIKRYDTSKEAIAELGGSIGAITQCCNKKLLTYKSYIWRWSLEEIDRDILERIKISRGL
jgi:group I intron endonuclease